jgi:hypothetical protein
MRRTLTAAVALLTVAAILVAVAAGGTGSTRHRVTIDITGADPFGFQLKKGNTLAAGGSATFCCWDSWDVTRAGAKVEVTNPRITLTPDVGRVQAQPRLTIRERIEWTPLSDGWSVFKGTWKVVGSSGAYRGSKGHGLVAGTWAPETDPNRMLRLRLTGFLNR